MGNRRKTRNQKTGKRDNRFRMKGWMGRGIEERHDFPLHDDSKPQVEQYGFLKMDVPEEDEVSVIKEVPAMHTGLPNGEHPGEKVRVGTAYIHDDSSIALKYDEDAPLWAMMEIQAFADKVGYSLETGGPNGSA